jgi:hypothetical protein
MRSRLRRSHFAHLAVWICTLVNLEASLVQSMTVVRAGVEGGAEAETGTETAGAGADADADADADGASGGSGRGGVGWWD